MKKYVIVYLLVIVSFSSELLFADDNKNTKMKKVAKTNSIVELITHPDENKWFISSTFEFKISNGITIENGFYFIIDDTPDTIVSSSGEWSKTLYISIDSGSAIQHGIHYFHVAIADNSSLPGETHHYKYNHFAMPLDITSPTHPNQENWYPLKNIEIMIPNMQEGISLRVVLNQNAETKPDDNAELFDSPHFVLHLITSGTYYLHILPVDSMGMIASEDMISHYQFNISKEETVQTAPKPKVSQIKITPIEIRKGAKISINATISLD